MQSNTLDSEIKGVSPVITNRIETILRNALAGYHAKIWIFGSRARGDHHATSDIDLGVESLMPCPLWRCIEALEESTVPYLVDLVELSGISADMASRIHHEGKILWQI